MLIKINIKTPEMGGGGGGGGAHNDPSGPSHLDLHCLPSSI